MTPPNPSEAAREAANETLANIMRKHIEDAARAEALAARLQSALSASAARVKELEATLDFYASHENWKRGLDGSDSSIECDYGSTARAALSIKVGETKDARD